MEQDASILNVAIHLSQKEQDFLKQIILSEESIIFGNINEFSTKTVGDAVICDVLLKKGIVIEKHYQDKPIRSLSIIGLIIKQQLLKS